MNRELCEVERPPGFIVEVITRANPPLGRVAAFVERGLRHVRRRRIDRQVEAMHRDILNGEAPSFGGRPQRDTP